MGYNIKHGFRFLAAWHAVGLIDKEVILASGTALLILSLSLSLLIGVLLSQYFDPGSEEIKKRTLLPPNPTPSAASRPAEERWLWHMLFAVGIGLLLLFACPFVAKWFPEDRTIVFGMYDRMSVFVFFLVVLPFGLLLFVGYLLWGRPADEKWVWLVLPTIGIGLLLLIPWSHAYSDGLLNNMPCVVIGPEKVKGVLLSNDSAYWYVLDDSKGWVSAIPLAEASEFKCCPKSSRIWSARRSSDVPRPTTPRGHQQYP